jgi:hypothetical protein
MRVRRKNPSNFFDLFICLSNEMANPASGIILGDVSSRLHGTMHASNVRFYLRRPALELGYAIRCLLKYPLRG